MTEGVGAGLEAVEALAGAERKVKVGKLLKEKASAKTLLRTGSGQESEATLRRHLVGTFSPVSHTPPHPHPTR